MASDPATLDRPTKARKTTKAGKAVAPRRGPTLSALEAEIVRAAREGPKGPRLGSMSRAERDKHLFGI